MSSAGQLIRSRAVVSLAVVLLCACAMAQTATPSGELSITPDATVGVVAGSGTAGSSGNGGSAKAATFDAPSAVAYDAAGNLYIADRRRNVVRRVDPTGVVMNVAGNGLQGFAGDGGKALDAELSLPSGLAVSTAGVLYIADTGNRRIRAVGSNGVLQTIAGDGTTAVFRRPVALAIGPDDALYVADEDAHRVWKVHGGAVSAFAGDGNEGFGGDGDDALHASLDHPSALALDAAGNLYIADRSNQRVRVVNATGKINTLAGADKPSLGGGAFSNPRGVSVATDGTVYVVDGGNHRVLLLDRGLSGTVAGSGEQGSSVAAGAARVVSFDRPAAIAITNDGAIRVGDTGSHQVQAITPASLSFADTLIGSQSAASGVTLSNTGSASLEIAAINLPTDFVVTGGSCGNVPVTLAPGASCNQSIVFAPTTTGMHAGSLSFSGTHFASRSLAMNGKGVDSNAGGSTGGSGGGSPGTVFTTTSLSSGGTVSYAGTSLVLNAQVFSAQPGMPTGTVQFNGDGAVLGSSTVSNGAAQWTVSSLTAGSHAYSAKYSGDGTFAASTSSTLTQIVSAAPDFVLDFASAGAVQTQTVVAGQNAVFQFRIAPQSGNYGQAVFFSASGLPAGATASFDPPAAVPGTGGVTVLLTIKTSAAASKTVSVALLIFTPLMLCLRRRRTPLVAVASVAIVAMAGCGGFRGETSSSNPDTSTKTYSITVTGTVTQPGGAVQSHSGVVTLMVVPK